MRNITIAEYLKTYQTNPNNFVLNAIKGKDNFPNKPFSVDKLTYNEVRTMFRKSSKIENLETLIDIISIGYKCELFEVKQLPITNFFQIKNFIGEKLVNLAEREAKILANANEDADIWAMAGGDKLRQYGDVLPLDRLAKLYGGYPLDYGEKKYVEVIYLLSMNAMQDRVEKKFYQLKNKTGRNGK